MAQKLAPKITLCIKLFQLMHQNLIETLVKKKNTHTQKNEKVSLKNRQQRWSSG